MERGGGMNAFSIVVETKHDFNQVIKININSEVMLIVCNLNKI